MALPKPRPGLVVGYDFLFREQAEAGAENAPKPHPAAVILVVNDDVRTRVSLIAISHTPPRAGEEAYRLKLSSAECREMGLDTGDHWINLRDVNSFDWPGYDLVRSAPGNSYVHGQMSKRTFVRVVEAIRVCAGRKVMSPD